MPHCATGLVYYKRFKSFSGFLLTIKFSLAFGQTQNMLSLDGMLMNYSLICPITFRSDFNVYFFNYICIQFECAGSIKEICCLFLNV